jgi:hypothetical protein
MDPKKNPRPLMAAVASQQAVIQRQAAEIAALRKAVETIAHYAALSKRIAEVIKTADERNPASPVPDPADEAPVQSSSDAVAPHASDDPRNLGATPGANDGLAAETTTTALTPGADIPTEPFNQLLDVTAPVAGTKDHVPDEQTRIEVDVRVGDPDNPEKAFPLIGEFEGEPSTGASDPDLRAGASRTRTFASLKLAKLRVAAGLADGDEIEVAGQIEAEAALTDDAIAAEIRTLEAVSKAAVRRTAAAKAVRPRTAGVQRTVPSLSQEPSFQRTASEVPVHAEVEDSDIFLDF